MQHFDLVVMDEIFDLDAGSMRGSDAIAAIRVAGAYAASDVVRSDSMSSFPDFDTDAASSRRAKIDIANGGKNGGSPSHCTNP